MENYVARFEMLGFGMIVHFGLYSILGKGGVVFGFERQSGQS